MADTDTWTPADDDYVREQLGALKADVDSLPLADVRFVRARGTARRRRTMLGWTAGAAAAALVAAVIGFTALGPDTSQPVPPALPSTTAPTTAPTTPVDREAVTPFLAQAAPLPIASEWRFALGHSSDFELSTVENREIDPCLGSAPAPVQQESLLSQKGNIQGGQTRWTVDSGSAQQLAEEMARSIGACRMGDFAVKAVQTDSWPHLYSYTAGDAGSGWYAVALSGRQVAVLNVVEPDHRTSAFSRVQVERLAAIATARLGRYGDMGSAGEPKTGTPTTPPPRTGPSENMPLSGVKPLISSSLFVPASSWSSKVLTRGQPTYAGPGDQEGSASIVECETDQFQAGVGGRYAVVSIRAGSGDANYVGKQRVRLFEDAKAPDLVRADITRLDQLVMKGCTSAGGNRTTAERGPVAGTYLLTTKVVDEASGTMYQWVGVTGMQTEGAVSTIVFHGNTTGAGFTGTAAQGFAELQRLMDLARLR